MQRGGPLAALAREVAALVVPDRCLGCRAAARGGLCERCWREVVALGAARRAAVPDAGPAARVVRRGKDAGARRAAQIMAALTIERAAGGRCALPQASLVTWVPPDPRRGAGRGYHLPALYARALGDRLGLAALPLLVREHAPPQRGSDLAQRHRNVRGRFHLDAGTIDCAGVHVLVVDDVTTTGATLEHAMAPLLAAGAVAMPFAFAAVPRTGSRLRSWPSTIRM